MDIKVGHDTKGPFAIMYGPSGIQWYRGEQANILAEHYGQSKERKTVTGGYDLFSVSNRLFRSIAELGQWYEMNQMRLIEEARFEERRINWLVSISNLVLNELKNNGRLDAKAAYYLSKEAQSLFEACQNNSKFDIPGFILYMCYVIRKYLAEFNIASHEYLSSALLEQGVLTTGSSIFGKTLEGFLGNMPIPNDADWLKYISAEDQLAALLDLTSNKKATEIDWKDVAKSAVLLTAFVPLPVFLGTGVVARTVLTAGNIAKGTAAGYSIQPLFNIIKGALKSQTDTKQNQLIDKYHDLLLLKFEAGNTARVLSVQGKLFEGTPKHRLLLFDQAPQLALPGPE